MSEFFVDRAWLIRMLTHEQVARLHATEVKCDYCIPAWNICKILNLGTIKKYYGAENGDLKAWSEQCTETIRNAGLLNHNAEGFVVQGNLEAVHSFDWGVWNAKDRIDLSYHAPRNQQGQMVDAIAKADVVIYEPPQRCVEPRATDRFFEED